MRWLIAYLFWLNVATFAMMAVDRHNAYYGLKRLPKWLYIIMACIGGIYGYLMALWLFDHRKRPGIRPFLFHGDIKINHIGILILIHLMIRPSQDGVEAPFTGPDFLLLVIIFPFHRILTTMT